MGQIEKRVWGYCRCGGVDQTDIENQVEQLKQYAKPMGTLLLAIQWDMVPVLNWTVLICLRSKGLQKNMLLIPC